MLFFRGFLRASSFLLSKNKLFGSHKAGQADENGEQAAVVSASCMAAVPGVLDKSVN